MKNRRIQIILASTLVVLVVATLFFAIKTSAQGSKLITLENESAQLAEQNQELNDRIISYTSLTAISKEANKMGMIQPEKYMYVTGNGIALR